MSAALPDRTSLTWSPGRIEELCPERIEPRLSGYLAFNFGPSQSSRHSSFTPYCLHSSREDSTWLSRKLPRLQGQHLGCNRLEGGPDPAARKHTGRNATYHSKPGGQLLTESAELAPALRPSTSKAGRMRRGRARRDERREMG